MLCHYEDACFLYFLSIFLLLFENLDLLSQPVRNSGTQTGFASCYEVSWPVSGFPSAPPPGPSSAPRFRPSLRSAGRSSRYMRRRSRCFRSKPCIALCRSLASGKLHCLGCYFRLSYNSLNSCFN